MCKDVEQRGAKVRRQGTELRELQHPLRLRSAVVGEQVKPDIFLQEGHIPLDVGRQELWIPSKLRRMPAYSRPSLTSFPPQWAPKQGNAKHLARVMHDRFARLVMYRASPVAGAAFCSRCR